MKIGVTGATGQLGKLVVEKLKSRGVADSVVALVRNKEKASELGVESRTFDYTQPEVLVEALKGIDHLLLISSSEVGQRAVQHKNVIEAAKAAGVKWIVYTSLLHATDSSMGLAPEHVETEELLVESGISFTILRNGWYSENYFNSLQGALQHGKIIGCAGDGKISSATRSDYADAAVSVLLSEGHEGNTYELAGDDSFTMSDLAAELSRQSGKAIVYENLPEEAYVEALKEMGLPEFVAQLLGNMDAGTSRNDLFDESRQLSHLTGKPTTPMSATIQSFLASVGDAE